ncbi:MAG: SDR family NAD(P)-dependent oxidoreductase [Candidatus Kapaibacterium sp.]
MNLTGKLTLITGASSGIGRACAEVFAEAGSNLILMARREEKLKELKNDLQPHGVKIKTFKVDVRNYEEVKSAIKSLNSELRNIDILINNAGLARGLEKIQEGVLNNWEEMIDTNVKGLLYVSREVLPIMAERKHGHVINIGSIAGHEVYPGGNVYCGTKHAVKAISKAMMIDMNGTNVRVTSIDPGLVETEFSKVRFHGDTDKAENVYKGYQPLRGSDIAEIALFAATRPLHVDMQQILVTPTAQATATILNKTEA